MHKSMIVLKTRALRWVCKLRMVSRLCLYDLRLLRLYVDSKAHMGFQARFLDFISSPTP